MGIWLLCWPGNLKLLLESAYEILLSKSQFQVSKHIESGIYAIATRRRTQPA